MIWTYGSGKERREGRRIGRREKEGRSRRRGGVVGGGGVGGEE